MTYADKLEKLADEASAHDYCFEREYGADCSAGQDLEDRGFDASASGIALARKVAALVRALENAEQYIDCQHGRYAHACGSVEALEQARNALADIEGEGK